MNNNERDSQLSAMFDDELPAGECELLARRLARDPALQARWGRYAVIGASLKGQAGIRLPGHDSVADRVRAALGGEPVHGSVQEPEQSGVAIPLAPATAKSRWLMPVGLAASAAAVAAFAIVWMRVQGPAGLVAQAPVPARVPATAVTAPAPATSVQVAQAPALVAQTTAVQTPPATQVVQQQVVQGSAPRSDGRERNSYVLPPPDQNAPVVPLPTRDVNYRGSPAQYPGPVH